MKNKSKNPEVERSVTCSQDMKKMVDDRKRGRSAEARLYKPYRGWEESGFSSN